MSERKIELSDGAKVMAGGAKARPCRVVFGARSAIVRWAASSNALDSNQKLLNWLRESLPDSEAAQEIRQRREGGL